jgi:hypothetical protein
VVTYQAPEPANGRTLTLNVRVYGEPIRGSPFTLRMHDIYRFLSARESAPLEQGLLARPPSTTTGWASNFFSNVVTSGVVTWRLQITEVPINNGIMFGVARPTLTGTSSCAYNSHGYFLFVHQSPQSYYCMGGTGAVKPGGNGPVLAPNAVVEVILSFPDRTLGFTYNGVAQQSYTNVGVEPLCLAVLFSNSTGAVRLLH